MFYITLLHPFTDSCRKRTQTLFFFWLYFSEPNSRVFHIFISPHPSFSWSTLWVTSSLPKIWAGDPFLAVPKFAQTFPVWVNKVNDYFIKRFPFDFFLLTENIPTDIVAEILLILSNPFFQNHGSHFLCGKQVKS